MCGIRLNTGITINNFRTITLCLFVLMLAACTGGQFSPTSVSSSQDLNISMFPNQNVFVEATAYDNKLLSLKRVDSITNPSKTLTFTFAGMDGKSMMLSVKNPFDSRLKYNIDMVDSKGNLHHTSSCPAVAQGWGFELWPQPIPELRITNLRFLKPDEEIVCNY